MANDKDKIYEQIYFLWKGEGEKRNESIDWYCEKYHVKVEDFRRWYKGISKYKHGKQMVRQDHMDYAAVVRDYHESVWML